MSPSLQTIFPNHLPNDQNKKNTRLRVSLFVQRHGGHASPSASFEEQKGGKTDHFITSYISILRNSAIQKGSFQPADWGSDVATPKSSLGDRIIVELIGDSDSFPKFEESADPVCPKTYCWYSDVKNMKSLGHFLPTFPFEKTSLTNVSEYLVTSATVRLPGWWMVQHQYDFRVDGWFSTSTTSGSMDGHAHVGSGSFRESWMKSSSGTRQTYHSKCLAGNSPRFGTFPWNTTANCFFLSPSILSSGTKIW